MNSILPDGHDQNDVSSSLSSDGVLTIVAPKKAIAAPNTERSVPIQKTGPVKEATPAAEQPKVEQAQ
jgi:crystallin, alpha B